MDGHVRGSGIPRAAGDLTGPALGKLGTVSRPRLISALDAGFDRPGSFVMVSAPAGYGKTYLLAEWADLNRARGRVTAWHHVTADDRDLVVLWLSLLGAIRQGVEERDRTADSSAIADHELARELSALRPSTIPQEHSIFVDRFRKSLESYGERIALIVDDAHLLQQSPAEDEFIRIIQSMPESVLLAFATRRPLQTQAARVDGRLRELTADSLSFTRTETTELFALRGFDDTDVEQLYAIADGWPAVLSLALLDVERDTSERTVVGDWTDPSILYDYMEHEIFDDLDSDARAVLLTLGVTPTTTGDLADAVSGASNSALVLRSLAMHNQVIRRVSTDQNARTWYGAKPLFGRFLRNHIRETHADELFAMIARGVDWHVQFGDAFVALGMALDPPNPELVDRILRRRGYELIADGHALRLLAMLSASNQSALTGPFARLMAAYAAACIPKPERAADFLGAINVEGLSADDLMEWDWLRFLVDAQLGLSSGKSSASLNQHNWPDDSLENMPDGLRLAIQLARGLAEARVGRVDEAVIDLSSALAVAENDDDLSNRVLGTVGLAAAATAQCDFRSANEYCREALALAALSTTQNQHGSRAMAHVLGSWSSLELLDVAAAREHAQAAVDSAARQPDPQIRMQASHVYNDAHFDLLPQRRRVTQELTTSWPPPYLDGASATYVVCSMYAALRMTFEIDEPRWGEHILDKGRAIVGESADWQVAYALHLLRTAKDDGARSVVMSLLDSPNNFAVRHSEIVALSISAVLESRSNNPFRAHSAVYRALEIADQTGAYLQVRIADPTTILHLILDGSGRFGMHEHVAHALLHNDGAASVSDFGALTAREREILLELTTLRTVEEIAHDMLLSVNTVKTHMRGIYRKLDVSSRRQAVANAERLGLL